MIPGSEAGHEHVAAISAHMDAGALRVMRWARNAPINGRRGRHGVSSTR